MVLKFAEAEGRSFSINGNYFELFIFFFRFKLKKYSLGI